MRKTILILLFPQPFCEAQTEQYIKSMLRHVLKGKVFFFRFSLALKFSNTDDLRETLVCGQNLS